MKVAIITADTKGYQDKTESKVGKEIQSVLEQSAYITILNATLPEDKQILSVFMNRLVDDRLADIVFTIGSCGVKPTDIIPEVTESVVDRLLPGVAEGIRAYNISYSKRHISDRGIAGVRQQTLVINLPDSERAAKDAVEYVLPELPYIVANMK